MRRPLIFTTFRNTECITVLIAVSGGGHPLDLDMEGSKAGGTICTNTNTSISVNIVVSITSSE